MLSLRLRPKDFPVSQLTWQALYKLCEQNIMTVIKPLISARYRQYELATQIVRVFEDSISESTQPEILLHQLRHQLLTQKSEEVYNTLSSFPPELAEKLLIRLLALFKSICSQAALEVPSSSHFPATPADAQSGTATMMATSFFQDASHLSRHQAREEAAEQQEPEAVIQHDYFFHLRTCLFLVSLLIDVRQQRAKTAGSSVVFSPSQRRDSRDLESEPADEGLDIPDIEEFMCVLQMLLMLPQDYRFFLFKPAVCSNDILIHLLEDGRISDVRKIFQELPQRCNDEVLTSYAQEWLLGESPQVNSARSLLDLCRDPQRVAQACLKISDLLGKRLPIRVTAINLMQKILSYAKYRLMSTSASKGAAPPLQSLPLCEELLRRVELLQLIQSDGGPAVAPVPSLNDLGDARKLVQLRDELIRQDRCTLALQIAAKTNIPTEPIYIAKGLSLLKAEKYNEAKEAFANVREKQQHLGSLSGHGGALDWAPILRQILLLLEETQSESSFLASRYMQCIYYLKTYGKPTDTLSFWLRHSLLVDAVNYCCSHKVETDTFLQTVVKHCATRGLLPTLQKALSSQPQERGVPYMLSVCKWLSHHQVWTVLLDWQLAMRDFQRASVSCLRLHRLVDRIEEQKAHLLMAKKHSSASDGSESEFVRMINYQLELFDVLPSSVQRLSLWNGAAEQLHIVV